MPFSHLPQLTADAIRGLDLLQCPVWVFDPGRQRHVHANPAALRLWRAPDLQSLLQRDLSDASDAIRARTKAAMSKLVRGAVVHERTTFYPLGQAITVGTVISAVMLLDGQPGMLLEGRILDVSAEEVRALEALRHTTVLVSLFDQGGAALFRNPVATAAYPGLQEFAGPFLDQAEAAAIWEQAWDGQPMSAEMQVQTAGGPRWHRIGLRRTLDPATGAQAMLVNEQDVSVAVDARLQVEHLATHDALTDLPNRTLFRRRLDAAAQSGQPFAVLMVDLDRFKAVNDTHGHAAGDAVLQAVAARLRGMIRQGDTLARLGGDEFGVLLPGVGHAPAAAHVAAALIKRVQEKCDAYGQQIQIGASIGIALHDGLGAAACLDTLVRAADRALYGAKAAGRDTYRVVV